MTRASRPNAGSGLTDFGARLSSEGEVVARIFGNYNFASIVNEISLHSRPASLEATTSVETDQPLILLTNAAEAAHAIAISASSYSTHYRLLPSMFRQDANLSALL